MLNFHFTITIIIIIFLKEMMSHFSRRKEYWCCEFESNFHHLIATLSLSILMYKHLIEKRLLELKQDKHKVTVQTPAYSSF